MTIIKDYGGWNRLWRRGVYKREEEPSNMVTVAAMDVAIHYVVF